MFLDLSASDCVGPATFLSYRREAVGLARSPHPMWAHRFHGEEVRVL
jgi:hypothetical protein